MAWLRPRSDPSGSWNAPAPDLPPPPASSWSDLYSREFLSMSFDAMALLDLTTGVVPWQNPVFQELAHNVGEGDPDHGLRILQSLFLNSCSRQLTRSEACVPIGTQTVQLRSAIQTHGPSSHGVALWVIHVSEPMSTDAPQPSLASVSKRMAQAPPPAAYGLPQSDPSLHMPRHGLVSRSFQPVLAQRKSQTDIPEPWIRGNMCFAPNAVGDICFAPQQGVGQGNTPSGVPSSKCSSDVTDPNLPDAVSPQPAGNYPKASDYPDPDTRVITASRGTRTIGVLWRKYGQKTLRSPDETAGSIDTPIIRHYHRCSQRSCQARLRVDTRGDTDASLQIRATGVHNHDIILSRSTKHSKRNKIFDQAREDAMSLLS